jgi:hypothetical protein
MPAILNKLLIALNECSGRRVALLSALARYEAQDEKESEHICERVVPVSARERKCHFRRRQGALFIDTSCRGERVLDMATKDCDSPDVRVRAYIYWRLLSMDLGAAKVSDPSSTVSGIWDSFSMPSSNTLWFLLIDHRYPFLTPPSRLHYLTN